tara:strand:- start:1897 stop:2298 length:402 start_codon:yes stop_codon:yes gene_type:complete
MDNQSQTNLKSAAFTLMGLIALFENDHVNESVRSDLVSVRDSIEKQIDALSIIEETRNAFTSSTPVAPIPPKKMENTYRIEEEVTSGWVRISDQTENLSRDKAKEIISNLIDREGYNPDKLKLVVDGQIESNI